MLYPAVAHTLAIFKVLSNSANELGASTAALSRVSTAEERPHLVLDWDQLYPEEGFDRDSVLVFTDSVLAYYQDRTRILSLRAFADQNHSFHKMKVLAIFKVLFNSAIGLLCIQS